MKLLFFVFFCFSCCLINLSTQKLVTYTVSTHDVIVRLKQTKGSITYSSYRKRDNNLLKNKKILFQHDPDLEVTISFKQSVLLASHNSRGLRDIIVISLENHQERFHILSDGTLLKYKT